MVQLTEEESTREIVDILEMRKMRVSLNKKIVVAEVVTMTRISTVRNSEIRMALLTNEELFLGCSKDKNSRKRAKMKKMKININKEVLASIGQQEAEEAAEKKRKRMKATTSTAAKVAVEEEGVEAPVEGMMNLRWSIEMGLKTSDSTVPSMLIEHPQDSSYLKGPLDSRSRGIQIPKPKSEKSTKRKELMRRMTSEGTDLVVDEGAREEMKKW
jgi:hypothetical protein